MPVGPNVVAFCRGTVCAATISVASCSFALTHNPAMATPPRVAPDCPTAMTWPTVDGAITIVATLLLLATVTGKNRVNDEDVDSRKVAVAVMVAGGAGIAAFVGHSRVTKCRIAHDAFLASNTPGDSAAPPPVAPPSATATPPAIAQPVPAVAPPPKPTTARPKPPPDSSLGTQGDVCATQAECANGFVCTGNVCLNK